MDRIWELLGLEPTQDVSAIKRAYAQKARICHPEENPEGFLQLRKAYQAALDYAEGQDMSMSTTAEQQTDHRDEPRFKESEEDTAWVFQEVITEDTPNPYENSEAIQQFVDLYIGKQRKNPKLWMDYFTSDAFLDAGWDSQFTALLLEKITEVESTCSPNREFMLWLSIAYQFSLEEKLEINREEFRVEKRERHLNFAPGAEFDGMQFISRIAAKGPIPKKPKGNEFAILQSFQDYRHLIHLAEAGRWDQGALDAYRNVLNRYTQSYIRERCEQRVTPDCERHPAGLRVFLHFFQRDDLPEAVYRDAWRRLDLKSAIMGRAKALYGPLRERVLAQVPGILGEAPENFLQLNRNLDAYLAQIKANPAEEETASAAFFASAEMQKALPSPRFVENQLLCYSKWRRVGMGEGLVRRMLEFYQEHPNIRRAAEAIEGLEGDLRSLTAKRLSKEDAEAEGFAYYEHLTLKYRPFFRHWLNTGFYTARDPETGTALQEYLEKCFPYQKKWSRRFGSNRRTAAAAMGSVEVDFYPLHMEFRVNRKPVYRPCLTWEETTAWGGDWFFYMLPITAAPYGYFRDVAQEIFSRLEKTAAPKDERALIAQCLAGYVCCLPLDEYTNEPVPPEKVLPLELCAEGGGRLHVCVWRDEEGLVTLYQQTASGRRVQREYHLEQGECSIEAAWRLLDEAVSPTRFDLSRLRELPWNIYYTPNGGEEEHLKRPDLQETPKPSEEERRKVYEILGKEIGDTEVSPEMEAGGLVEIQSLGESALPIEPVTEEALSTLLVRFHRDELERLEMSWIQGTLVLRRDGSKYACLYFENRFSDYGEYWYSLLSDSEMYRTVDSSDIVYLPFGMGKLPEYSIFESAAELMENIGEVLALMGWGKLEDRGGRMWSCDVSLHDSKQRLLMAQQKMGGVSPRRGRNHLLVKFIPSRYPVQIEGEDIQGKRTLETLKGGSYGQAAAGLTRFMMEKLSRLRLSWVFQAADGEAYYRHMVLLRDNGRFMLLWLQDDKQRADAYASNDPATFLGHVVPACLVHQDLMRIRNCVDLLLDDIDCTEPVVDRPGEFVPLSLPYGEIRTALVKEE